MVLIVVAIYVLLPNLIGAGEAVDKLDEAVWYWVVIAVGFNVLAFAAYVALFRGVLGGTHDDELHRRLHAKVSYQITMAGLAATRSSPLPAWAASCSPTGRCARPACRGGARPAAWSLSSCSPTRSTSWRSCCSGSCCAPTCCPGPAPVGGTIVPAALAAGVMAIFLLIALIPQDFERRIQRFAGGYRRVRYLQRLAKGPATLATGTRTALAYIRHPAAAPWRSAAPSGSGPPTSGAVGELRGLRRRRPLRRARAGLLRRHGRQPDSLARGWHRLRRRGMIFAFDVLFGLPSAVVFPPCCATA